MTKPSNESRAFDVVVWGASGFTGRLVAEHLWKTYGVGGKLRWAMAGRNREKLTTIADQITRKFVDQPANKVATPPASPSNPDNAKIPILIADANDKSSLVELAKQAKVVCSTVGPFALYGSLLVAACAETGTDYCDITGEAHWIRRMIDEHEAQARDTGARLVHCCGFDSIPSDLGVWYLQRHFRAKYGRLASAVELLVVRIKGSFSGGTVASMLNIIEASARDPDLRRLLANPYLLNPQSQPARSDKLDEADKFRPSRAKNRTTWTAPFVMAPINTRIVRRSHALTHPDARFRYSEATMTGSGFGGGLRAWVQSIGTVAFLGALAFPPSRALLRRTVLPDPGEGPDAQSRENGCFEYLITGRDGSPQNPESAELRVRVKGDRDPGYGATSRMLGESAVCLALDIDTTRGGSWTPATAMGDKLIERLEANAGMRFEVEDA